MLCLLHSCFLVVEILAILFFFLRHGGNQPNHPLVDEEGGICTIVIYINGVFHFVSDGKILACIDC